MGLSGGITLDGKYKLIEPLGEGGMGVVWVAEHVGLGKRVALKVLRPELCANPEVAARFQTEARAASAVEHENVVRVTDFGRAPGGELYLVMDLLAGRSLYDELQASGRLSRSRAVFIAVEIARALEAAHAAGVVHRDLKPENVIIAKGRGSDGGDAIRVVDFGLARIAGVNGALGATVAPRVTTTGMVMGTPLYMAPEQARGLSDVDGRADLYALGVMLYEMLAGRTPYEGSTFFEIAHAVLEAKPRPLGELVPELPPSLVAIVGKAMAPAREQRFQTATELREALARVARDSGPETAAALRDSDLVELPRGREAETIPQTAEARARRGAGAPGAAEATAGPPPITLDNNAVGLELDRETLPHTGVKPTATTPARAGRTPAGSMREVPLEESAAPLELDRPTAAAAPVAAKGRGGVVGVLVAIAVVAALGIGGFVVMRGRAGGSGGGGAIPARVRVDVVDLPRGGKVIVDDVAQPLPTFELPGGRAPLRVRIEAPRHATRLLHLVPDHDQTLDGKLDRSR